MPSSPLLAKWKRKPERSPRLTIQSQDVLYGWSSTKLQLTFLFLVSVLFLVLASYPCHPPLSLAIEMHVLLVTVRRPYLISCACNDVFTPMAILCRAAVST